MDKVCALPNLRKALARVKANGGAAGVDQQSVAMYERQWEANLEKLSASLRDRSYRPQAMRRMWIPKPGSREKRGLGIPAVRDRVGQAALLAVLFGVLWFGCGGGGGNTGAASGTPAGTYTLNVSGTSGSKTHSVALTLTVQ